MKRAFARFRDDIRAVGLVVGGSLARGGADFYSDVDLYVVVLDGAFEDVFAERNSTAEAVGSPLFGFAVDPAPGRSTDHIVLCEGPVKFDFMYLRESDLGPHPRWDGCVVLKDELPDAAVREDLEETGIEVEVVGERREDVEEDPVQLHRPADVRGWCERALSSLEG